MALLPSNLLSLLAPQTIMPLDQNRLYVDSPHYLRVNAGLPDVGLGQGYLERFSIY